MEFIVASSQQINVAGGFQLDAGRVGGLARPIVPRTSSRGEGEIHRRTMEASGNFRFLHGENGGAPGVPWHQPATAESTPRTLRIRRKGDKHLNTAPAIPVFGTYFHVLHRCATFVMRRNTESCRHRLDRVPHFLDVHNVKERPPHSGGSKRGAGLTSRSR
jgi:hypothetical protein